MEEIPLALVKGFKGKQTVTRLIPCTEKIFIHLTRYGRIYNIRYLYIIYISAYIIYYM